MGGEGKKGMVKRKTQHRNGERTAFAREQRQHFNEFSSLVWNMLSNRKVMHQNSAVNIRLALGLCRSMVIEIEVKNN